MGTEGADGRPSKATRMEQLAEHLRALLEPDPRVFALWHGGSAAWGATDQYSDLDLQAVVEDGAVEEVFALVQKALSPVSVQWRMPEPAWHGYSQCFYQFEGLPEWSYLDLCLLEKSKLGRFDEIEHHGQPVVLFDKGSFCQVSRLDLRANQQEIEKRRIELRARHELFGHFCLKEVRRGDPLAAGLWFDRMLFDPLVELLRMRHCPERFSFGRRYLRRDLPAEVYDRLVALRQASMEDSVPEIRGWIRELLGASVAAVSSSSEHGFHKFNRPSIKLLSGIGVEGDAHAGKTVQHLSRVRKDPTQPNLRQVHLIHEELLDELRLQGFSVAPGELGENVTTRGLDLLGLPTGTRLALGSEAVVELTGLRNPCAQLDKFQPGLLKAVLERDEAGGLVRKSGVMAVVVRDGEVRPGDRVVVELPVAPHRSMEPV